MQKVVMVQGLQYGSEAKGSICAGVAKHWGPDTVATAWGPNAGHTVRDGYFRFVSSMLATGALYPSVQTVLVGPGSVVDFTKLAAEVELAGDRLKGKTILIHPRAAYLKPEHAELEKSLLRIGSTMKGTMQATVAKMHRVETAVVGGAKNLYTDPLHFVASKAGVHVAISEDAYDRAVDVSQRMLIEGAQGYSLGLHGQFYPYCTSRDVSPAQVLADCRIPLPCLPSAMAIIGVLRTYPIRVANRRSEDGQEYTSGGFYSDQHEIDWASLGREPELTTVTKLPRRIFSFSFEQLQKAVRQVTPSVLALTFCDYLEDKPEITETGVMGTRVDALVRSIHMAVRSINPTLSVDTVSYGPDLSDIFEVQAYGTLAPNRFGFLISPEQHDD